MWYRWTLKHKGILSHNRVLRQEGIFYEQHARTTKQELMHRLVTSHSLKQQATQIVHIRPLPTLTKRIGSNHTVTLVFWSQWFEELYHYLHTGHDLHSSLQHMLQHSLYQEQAQLNQQLIQHLEQGQALYLALKQASLPLPAQYLHNFTFAERTGQLESIAQELHQHILEHLHYIQTYRKHLAYPTFLLILMIGIALGLKTWLMPQFQQLYQAHDAPLPDITLWFLSSSETVFSTTFLLFTSYTLLIGVGFYVLFLLLSKSSLRARLLHYPLWFIVIERKHILTQIKSLAQAMLLGMTIQQALHVLMESVHDTFYYQLLSYAMHDLHQGLPARQVFSHFALLPQDIAAIELGEQTGQLPQQLLSLVQRHEKHREKIKTAFLASLPHVLLGLISICVAVFIIALYLPLFQLGNVLY